VVHLSRNEERFVGTDALENGSVSRGVTSYVRTESIDRRELIKVILGAFAAVLAPMVLNESASPMESGGRTSTTTGRRSERSEFKRSDGI
jgi:hypothetical protein